MAYCPVKGSEEALEVIEELSFVSADVVYFIVERVPESMRAQNKEGQNLAHLAVDYRQLDAIRFMVEHAPESMNVKNTEGRTVVHVAAEAGMVEIVEYLSEHVPVSMDEEENGGHTSAYWVTLAKQVRLEIEEAPEAWLE